MLLLFSSSVMSDSLQPHGLSLTRLPSPWISQARILEWVVIFFCRISSPSRDQTSTSCLAGRFFSTELSSVQFSRSVMSDSLRPHGLQHQLPEFTQTNVHWVSDAIQLSHPLSSPSSPTFNLSQHQGLFQWVCSSYQVAKVLEFQLQH